MIPYSYQEKIVAKKDWAGQKFNRLTFIKPVDKKDGREPGVIWELFCGCGKTTYAKPSRVARGHTKSCGCLKKDAVKKNVLTGQKDRAGQKFNKLTFVKSTDKKIERNIVWELLCDCGNIIYKISSVVVNGSIKSCGCLVKEISGSNGTASRTYHPIISSARVVWQGEYKDGNIDFDTFYNLSQMPCHYCGVLHSNSWNKGKGGGKKQASQYQLEEGTFKYNGLDRVDNSIGHMKHNVVPCCRICNWMKMHLSEEEFLTHVERISQHQKTKLNLKQAG